MGDILLTIILVVSVQMIIIILQEHVLGIHKKKYFISYSTIQLNARITPIEKNVINKVIRFLDNGDFYFNTGNYLEALYEYREVLSVLTENYVKTNKLPVYLNTFQDGIESRINKTLENLNLLGLQKKAAI